MSRELIPLTGEQFAPVSSAFGFVRAEPDQVVECLRVMWKPAAIESVKAPFPESLKCLEPLSLASAGRVLVIGTMNEEWTALFNDNPLADGGGGNLFMLRTMLNCDSIGVSCSDDHSNADGGGHLGAVVMSIDGPGRGDQAMKRYLYCANQGSRWEFTATGPVQEWERPDVYRSRRVRDRFRPQLMAEYGRAVGLDIFDESFYCGPTTLLTRPAVGSLWSGSFAEAQLRWGWCSPAEYRGQSK